MDSSSVFRPKVTAAALTLTIVCVLCSCFLLNSMNLNFVHSTLYSYGLTFSLQWANPYWQLLNYQFITIAASIFFATLALAAIVFAVKRGFWQAQKWVATFTMLTLLTTVCSSILFSLTNNIVNEDLYGFGLQFNTVWFSSYQWYFTGFVALQIAVMTLSVFSFSTVSFSNKQPLKISAPKIITPTLLIFGGILIGLSLIYDAALAFFGGFALVFWGSMMVFISGERLVKKDVYEATSLTYISTLGKAVNRQDQQKMVYAPIDSPNLTQNYPLIQIRNVELSFNKPELVNLAPENELFNLIERTYRKSFSGCEFSEFETVLPKVLVESLELAENVRIEANGDVVRVILEKPFDWQVYVKAKNQAALIDAFGFPLSGAIAYALANSSGKHVMINRHLISQDGKTVQFEYTLLGQRSVQA